MRFGFRSFRMTLPASATLFVAANLFGQQPLPMVELAQPIVAEPLGTAVPFGPAPAKPAPAAPSPALRSTAPPPVALRVSDDPAGDAAPSTDQHDVAAVPLDGADSADAAPGDSLDASLDVEVIKERYPSGVVRIEREVTQDDAGNYIPHGLWRQFDPTGRAIAEGRYLNSKKEGIWRRIYSGEDAALLKTAPYASFTAPFVSQALFEQGNLNGKWVITDAKERKVHELQFQDGERHGTSVWYYPSGQIMLQAQYDHGRASGEVIQYGPDSAILARENYEEGRKLAAKIEYYDPQQHAKKAEAMYLHAALHIKTPDNWDTCTLAVFEARGQDEKHGPFTAWHQNGQLARQGEFRYDLPVGTFIYWFSNGQKQMEGTYVDGRQDGTWTWWHMNGLKSIAGVYEQGTPVGVWNWWQPSGKLAQKTDLTKRSDVGPTPEPEDDPQTSKVKLAEPVVEVR